MVKEEIVWKLENRSYHCKSTTLQFKVKLKTMVETKILPRSNFLACSESSTYKKQYVK